MKNIKFLFKHCIKYWYLMIIIFALIFISQYLRTVIPLFTTYTIDFILQGKEVNLPLFFGDIINYLVTDLTDIKKLLFVTVLLYFAISVIRSITIFVLVIVRNLLGLLIGVKVRNDLYTKFQNLSFSFHKKHEKGDLIQRSTTDIETFRLFASSRLFDMFRIILLICLSLYQMFKLNKTATTYSLILLPIIFLLALFYFKKEKRLYEKVEESEANVIQSIQENITNVRVVKAFSRENYEAEKFEKISNDYVKKDSKRNVNVAIYWSVSDFLVYIQMGLTLFIGVYFVYTGELTLGELTAMYLLVRMVIFPVRELGRIVSEIGRTSVSITRLREIFDEEDEYIIDGDLTPEITGNLELSNVSFKFDDGVTDSIKNLSFKINKGETVALIGKTGSGKSTLINLLIRMLEYQEGSIKFDDVDLKDIKKSHIREQIGVILQEPFLYAKTIYDNMKILDDSLTEEQIQNVTKIACVHDDIVEFKEGYKTLVGERGVTLSGGQKQRLAIARALIKEKSILIFDDSLSAVDNETDKSIRDAIYENNKNQTTIIITHKITNAINVDKIIVLNEGEVAEIGNHNELLNSNGIYSKLWDVQNNKKEEN